MATLTLYKNKSLPRVVSKTLTGATSITANPIGPFNERNPRFEVGGISDIDQYDYFEFDGKYYFMQTTVQDCTQIVIGYIDVLMSFPSVVGQLDCYIERGDTENPNIPDGADTLLAYQTQDTIQFATGFSEDEADGAYILVTAQNNYHRKTT